MNYTTPEIEMLELTNVDIITASNGNGFGNIVPGEDALPVG